MMDTVVNLDQEKCKLDRDELEKAINVVTEDTKENAEKAEAPANQERVKKVKKVVLEAIHRPRKKRRKKRLLVITFKTVPILHPRAHKKRPWRRQPWRCSIIQNTTYTD